MKINQLQEELNEKTPDLKIKMLREENSRLHKLVNKHQESKIANKISVNSETDIEVSNSYVCYDMHYS